MDDESDRLDLENFLKVINSSNPKQRQIVDGVMAILQAIEDEEAAAWWLEENRTRILDELRRAR